MPNCFTLTRLNKPEEGPVSLTKIDEEMCKHFNVECDPVKYYCEWYNTIGLMLAIGRTFEEIFEIFEGSERTIEIAKWLQANFTTDAWYSAY